MSSQISWEEVVSSTRVVASRSEALAATAVATTTPGDGAKKNKSLLRSFAWQSLKRFWRWHLPLVGRAFLVVEALRVAITMLSSWRDERLHDERKDITTSTIMILLGRVVNLIAHDTAWALCGFSSFSNDYPTTEFWRIIMALMITLSGRFIIVTFILVVFRILQRLSWRTTELGTYPNVKDSDPRYQDEELLNKAWSQAAASGWQDPTTCSDFEEGVGGGAVVMQPCPGYCGIATLNSTLRSFGGAGAGASTASTTRAPYLTMPSHTRYVTLEEMVQLVQNMIRKGHGISNTSDTRSEWEKGDGGPVDESSMQVIGGGSKGLASVEQFRAALRQLSHPTQPACIMAIYHRSPLFFCSENRSFMSKLACFPMVHWSPVLAYLEEEDLVLVMDVNHTYGPKGYLLPTRRFYDSVNTRDLFTGNYHGLILLRPPPPKGVLPLLSSPQDLSVAFGKIKQAYYRHQAAGRTTSAADILASNEEGYKPLPSNEHGEKLIRLVSSMGSNSGSSSSKAEESVVSAVVSAHPVFFANEIFIESGCVPSLESVRTMVDAFSKLRVAPRVLVRGFDSSTASKVHRILTAAGLVQIRKSAIVMFLNLDPSSTSNGKTSTERLAQGYDIKETTWTAQDGFGRQGHSQAVEDLAKLIVESYKFPNIVRRGHSPSDFYAQAYQTFNHGYNLRHFACYERESGEMASCAALFCDTSGKDGGIRPDVAALYNVCTSPNHRRKGLGMAITLYALEEAKKMGCQQVVLEASKQGKSLYESMGFIAMNEDVGGIYVSLSVATDDFKWKNVFRLLELYCRIKSRFE